MDDKIPYYQKECENYKSKIIQLEAQNGLLQQNNDILKEDNRQMKNQISCLELELDSSVHQINEISDKCSDLESKIQALNLELE